MKLFVLRATMRETYDCPDNGETFICDRYEDVAFSTDRTRLGSTADDLNAGFGYGCYWSERRQSQLRELHAGYDVNYTYSVCDISELILEDGE